jgi:hypothetical protein
VQASQAGLVAKARQNANGRVEVPGVAEGYAIKSLGRTVEELKRKLAEKLEV